MKRSRVIAFGALAALLVGAWIDRLKIVTPPADAVNDARS